nr:uncharacterized protein LOC127304016 [Lolium perenne]
MTSPKRSATIVRSRCSGIQEPRADQSPTSSLLDARGEAIHETADRRHRILPPPRHREEPPQQHATASRNAAARSRIGPNRAPTAAAGTEAAAEPRAAAAPVMLAGPPAGPAASPPPPPPSRGSSPHRTSVGNRAHHRPAIHMARAPPHLPEPPPRPASPSDPGAQAPIRHPTARSRRSGFLRPRTAAVAPAS